MSEEPNARFNRPMGTVAPKERRAKPPSPKALLKSEKARAIFLSLDSIRNTAKAHGVSEGMVAAIWSRLRWHRATVGLKRPSRAEIEAHRQKLPKPKSAARLRIEAFVAEHAGTMTATEMAKELGCTAHHVRLICREMSKAENAPVRGSFRQRDDLQPNAAEGFEPAPLPPGESLDAPAGSAARIAKYRDRANRGVELYDPDDDPRGLPMCAARIEKAKLENVS